MAILYRIGVTLAKGAFAAFARFEVQGRELVPPRGRLIIVSNHMSNADPPVVAASIPRRLFFMAKRGLFANRLVTSILDDLGAYPLDRDGRDVGALLWSLKLLEQDQAVLFFPEGTRSRDGCMHRARPGVAYAAVRTRAPILPVAITGTERIPGLWRVAVPFCTIRVRIGQPFTLPPIEGEVTRPVLEHLTDVIMRHVASMLPEEYRGYYDTGSPPPGGDSSPGDGDFE